MSTKAKKWPLIIVIAGLVTYIVQAVPQGVSPVLATLMLKWPEVATTNITLLATIIGVAALPTALLSQSICKKLSIKVTLMFGSLVCIVFGSLPAFLPMDYLGVLITRIVLGLGYGLIYPLGATVITNYFPDVTQRSKVMGWAGSMSTVSGVAFATGAGYLVTIGDGDFVWIINAIMIIAFVFAIIMPSPEKYAGKHAESLGGETEETVSIPKAELGKKAKIGRGWFYIIACFVFMLFAYPFALFISSVIMDDGLGSSIEAGYAMTLFNIGGILSGFLFPVVSKFAKDRVFAIGLLLLFVTYCGLSLANSIVIIYLCMLFLGIGFMFSMIYLNIGCTVWIPTSVLARGMGIQLCGTQFANFAAGFMYPFLAVTFGFGGNPRFAFYVAVLVFIIAGLFFLIKPRRVVTSDPRQPAQS